MKFLKSGDIHLKAFANEPTYKGLPESLYYNMSALTNMANYAIEKHINNIVFSGDLFHTKSIIHSLAQALLLDFLRKYKDIYFYIMDGNHDMSSKSGDGVSALKCCDNEENVITIHKSIEIDNIWFVPWDPKNMYQDIKNGSPHKVPYLISHLGLNEGKLNSGISIISDIGLKDLKQYKRVFLSHYHAAQEIENVMYVGSLIQLDWGEKNEEKRFLEIDTDNDTVISVPSTGFKKYCEFNVTKDNVEKVLLEVEQLKKEGHNVKVRKKEEVDLQNIEKDVIIINDIETDITNRGIDSSMSREEKLEKYLQIKEIPSDKFNYFKEIGIDIINSIIK